MMLKITVAVIAFFAALGGCCAASEISLVCNLSNENNAAFCKANGPTACRKLFVVNVATKTVRDATGGSTARSAVVREFSDTNLTFEQAGGVLFVPDGMKVLEVTTIDRIDLAVSSRLEYVDSATGKLIDHELLLAIDKKQRGQNIFAGLLIPVSTGRCEIRSAAF